MKELLPTVDANSTIFAHRFPITPGFLPATFQVWYETTINTAVGGGLPQLQHAQQATHDYYVFDYQNGNVVNLMPELQEHEETLFLWAQDGRLEQITPSNPGIVQAPDVNLNPVVAGPEGDLRLTIVPPALETAVTWNSLIYPITPPANSQLQFSLFHQDTEAAFRVRLLGRGSEWETLLETTIPTPNQCDRHHPPSTRFLEINLSLFVLNPPKRTAFGVIPINKKLGACWRKNTGHRFHGLTPIF